MEDHDKSENLTQVSETEDTGDNTADTETPKKECENAAEKEPLPDSNAQEVSEVTENTGVNEVGEETAGKDDTMEAEGEDIEVDEAAIEKLTHGVLEMFLPNLQKAKGSLNELLHNQEVLIETVQQENSKFTDSTALKDLVDMMHEAKRYHTKLVNLKREMNALTEKSTKLKRRAVKIQQQKQKEELTRADQIEREKERERMLTAKVAKPSKDQKD